MSDTPGLGVAQLDALLAPVPAHANLVLLNDPGVQGEPFLYQAAGAHLAAGRDVVFVVTSRPPQSVADDMSDYGFPPTHRLHFVDAYSALMGESGGVAYALPDPADLSAFAALLERAASEHPDAVLLVDTLSTFVDASPELERVVAGFPRILDAMKRFRLSASLFTTWPYPDTVVKLLDSFDATVRLRGVEERVVTSQYFSVERATWLNGTPHAPRLYRAIKPGGVFVYIPKILVTGPYNAGKSTFIQTVSDKAVSVDRLGTTVALDHGHVALDGLTADLFGTPGQSRFDPILRTLAAQAVGVIVVVDATKPESFQRARDMMGMTWKHGLPAVIAANKQDQPNALPPEEVARLMEPPGRTRVIGCVGAERDSSRRVLQELIDLCLTPPEEVPS